MQQHERLAFAPEPPDHPAATRRRLDLQRLRFDARQHIRRRVVGSDRRTHQTHALASLILADTNSPDATACKRGSQDRLNSGSAANSGGSAAIQKQTP